MNKTSNKTSSKAAHHQEGDQLWKMLAPMMGIAEIREMQTYLRGESHHYDMGYGDLAIEPYDARGGTSTMFRIRHLQLGELTVSRAVLQSILQELLHELRRTAG